MRHEDAESLGRQSRISFGSATGDTFRGESGIESIQRIREVKITIRDGVIFEHQRQFVIPLRSGSPSLLRGETPELNAI